jgi:hypothetical protein
MLLSKITCANFVKEIIIKKPYQINDKAYYKTQKINLFCNNT